MALLACNVVMAQTRTFDIPSEDAAKSIPEFARQAGIQIIAPVSQLRGRKTARVRGTMDERDALRLLLEGTGLRVASDTGSTIVLARSKGSKPHTGKPTSQSVPPPPLEEVVVTGSHIKGGGPVGSEVIEFSREEMISQGYSTVQDAIRSLPEQVNAGPNEYTGPFGSAGNTQLASADRTGGTAINLRGLGANSTLTLIDGHRIAPSGPAANYYDISSIPLEAISRVEILADGASAVYGSDAVGGVVNIKLRKNFSGAVTSLDYGAAQGFWRASASQVIGATWQGGQAMLTYQHLRQSDLSARSRDYVRENLVPFGGSDFRFANYGEPGTLSVGGKTYAIPPGQSGVGLAASSLVPGTSNESDVYPYYDIVPRKTQDAFLLTASQRLTHRLTVFLDATVSLRDTAQSLTPYQSVLQVPKSNAFWVSPSPTAKTESVYYRFTHEFGADRDVDVQRDYAATAGMAMELPKDWSAELSGTFSAETLEQDLHGIPNSYYLNQALASSDPATAFNPFGDGTGNSAAVVSAISGYQKYGYRNRSGDLFADANGPLLHLPAGDLLAAFGAEGRHESIAQDGTLYNYTAAPIVPSGFVTLGRTVVAEFGELDIPVIGRSMGLGGLQSLSLSAAVRHEHYSDMGDSTNPRFGIEAAVAGGLRLRASYGTSFSAPLLIYMVPPRYSGSIMTVADPQSPTGKSTVIVRGGNAPNLQPETSRNWTLGGSWAPDFISGLRLQATYFNIHFTNRLSSPANVTTMLQQESIYSSLIVRNPSVAMVNALQDAPNFQSAPVDPTTIGAILDDRLESEKSQFVDGLDLSASFTHPLGGGLANIMLSGTKMLDYRVALTRSAPDVQLVDNAFYPTSWKTRSGVSWTRGGITLAGYVNWQNGYQFVTDTAVNHVASFTTLDLSANIALSRIFGKALASTRLMLSAQNALNRDPPFVNMAGGYDATNASALGRFLSARLSHDW